MQNTAMTRRGFFRTAGTLSVAAGAATLGIASLAAPAKASAPFDVKLTRKRIGSNYRVRIWASIHMGPVNVSNRYIGQMYVPVNGAKKVQTFNTNLGFQIQVAAQKLSQTQKVQARLMLKMHQMQMAIIRNI